MLRLFSQSNMYQMIFSAFCFAYIFTRRHKGIHSHSYMGPGARPWEINASMAWITWSYFNNPGGLALLESASIAVGYDNRFGLKELSTLDFTAAW